MILKGRIISSLGSGGVPYANIEVVDYSGVYQGIRTETDSAGYFTLSSPNLDYSDNLLISSVGYQKVLINSEVFFYQPEVVLESNLTTLPEVNVTAPAKAAGSTWILWLALAAGGYWLMRK